MVKPYNAVHELKALSGAESPSLGQHLVVNIFQAQACYLSKDIQRVKDFLNIHQPDFPGAPLIADQRPQRGSGGAMASAGVEVQKVDLRYALGAVNRIRHYCFIPTSLRCYARGLKG